MESWKPKKHYKMISSWYQALDREAPSIDNLPEAGFVIEGKAAGWLTRTDSNTAILEIFVYNPLTTPKSRVLAISSITGALLDLSITLGYTRVIALTDEVMLQNAIKKHSFYESTQRVYILDESYDEDVDNWVDD